MENIYWVGVKESEIQMCKHLFKGSITFIGSGKNGNISYSYDNNYIINYNEDSIELDNFMRNSLHQLINMNNNVLFFCYTPSYIYSLEDPEISKRIICTNSRNVLQLLRNKMNCKLWLNQYVPVLPTIILSGNNCDYINLCNMFPSETMFTIQGCTGSGGVDTYIMSENNYIEIKSFLYSDSIYLISPYKQKSFSTNIHIIFTENGYYITPGSIQIVEKSQNRMIYRGCDFVEYKNIPQNILNKIYTCTTTIAEKIKDFSYKGILGIDYLISENDVYFLEINPRFQSSTRMLNLALTDRGYPSIQEILLDIFYNNKINDLTFLSDLNINYSNYIIDYDENYDYKKYYQIAASSTEVYEIVLDGYSNDIECQTGASIFSITFKQNIVSINPNSQINIYDNIKPFIKKEVNLCNEEDCKWLKFAIMNQGINFSSETKDNIDLFQKGVYSSLDIYINDKFIINAPIDNDFVTLSPFIIKFNNDQLALYYGDIFVSFITIKKREKYCDKYTRNNINFQHISFIATDRLRIHHSPNCLFQTLGEGCKFCDVPGNGRCFNESDILEVIDWHIRNSNFRHILIGGASGAYPHEYVTILKLIKYIREKTSKAIYLMTLPPKDCSILDEYFEYGVNEIAFNIEIFNRQYAKRIMPGKGKISLETYKNALLHGVELWGKTGNVRSLLIYGLEPDSSFWDGILWLTSNGIQPIISPFRALNGTAYKDTVPPSTQKLMKVYAQATEICNKFNLNLGPDCIYCQNNTLSFDSAVISHLYN